MYSFLHLDSFQYLDGCNTNWIGDGYCNDETNKFKCNYDGGDCCVNINVDHCSDCNCLGRGVIKSPGFPGFYNDNLDLNWLIQSQIGQRIEIIFLDFDVELNQFDCCCR